MVPTQQDLPILYSFRRCPYAMRARLAILEAGRMCELREVVLRDKPPELLAVSPKGTVPVLVLPNQVLDESLDIVRFVLSPDHPWRASEHSDSELISLNDGPFKYHLDRAKYASRYPGCDPSPHWAASAQILRRYDAALSTGSLSAHGFGLADLCIGPFVRQLVNHAPGWFDGLELPRLGAWLEAFVTHERFTAIMTKYPQWRSGDPPVVWGADPKMEQAGR